MADLKQNDLFSNLKDARILVIGGESDIVDIFTKEDYTAVTHAQKAADISAQFLREWRIPGQLCLAILSLDLPDGDPFELCRVLSQQEMVPVVVVGDDGINEWKAANAGASDHILSKTSPQILFYRCEKILAQHYFAEQTEKSSRRHQKMFVNILQVMAKVLEARDPTTMHHSEDVARYARRLARKIGWDEEKVKVIGVSAMLHDIGKVGIKEALLTKPGPLTDDELKIFQKHPLVAVAILDPIAELRETIEMVKHHHEWYDGSGYPDGLKGENIPLGARIIHLTDAYECMMALRPYQQTPLSQKDAIEEIRRCAGTQFDPHLAEVFIEMEGKE